MMKTGTIKKAAVFSLAGALGLAGCRAKEDRAETAYGNPPPPATTDTSRPGATGMPEEVAVRVVAVDKAAPSITVAALGEPVAPEGMPATTLERTILVGGGAVRELETVKVGDQVTLTCEALTTPVTPAGTETGRDTGTTGAMGAERPAAGAVTLETCRTVRGIRPKVS
jgi:hypothetical protein